MSDVTPPEPTSEPTSDDLSLLLDIAEIQVLQQQGLDPNAYTIAMLSSHNVQVSNQMPDGSYVMQLQIRLPPGIFKMKKASRLLLPNQPPPNPLEGIIGLPPSVRIVALIEGLTDSVRGQISNQVQAMLTPPEAD